MCGQWRCGDCATLLHRRSRVLRRTTPHRKRSTSAERRCRADAPSRRALEQAERGSGPTLTFTCYVGGSARSNRLPTSVDSRFEEDALTVNLLGCPSGGAAAARVVLHVALVDGLASSV